MLRVPSTEKISVKFGSVFMGNLKIDIFCALKLTKRALKINPMNLGHIIITGASSGIGEALALHYAGAKDTDAGIDADGLMLSLTGRNQERLAAVAEACRARGAVVNEALICVTEREAMEKWLLEMDDLRPVDLIVANAGISAGTGVRGVLEVDAQVRDIFAVNVDGVFNTVHPLMDKMMARGGGHIVLMSSLSGFRGFPGAPAYCASKAAVKVYGEGLRGALAGSGVKVHVIMPGFVKSRMTAANDFPMPFLVESSRAAEIIAKRIKRGKGRIAFPLPMVFFAWLLGALPNDLAEFLTKEAPVKAKN